LGTANAALDGAGEAAGLALEMKAERERMKMAEGGERHLPHRALTHLGKDGIAQLGKELRADARYAISDDKRHRQRDDGGVTGRERIDGALVEQRHVDVDELGADEEDERNKYAPAQRPILRPEKGRKTAYRLEFLAKSHFRGFA